MELDNSSGSPVKRKYGPPRKDQSLKHVKTAHVPPGFVGLKESWSKKDARVNENDAIVGEAVTGVVEATFDAGYLLTVRVGNSTTNLRGVVFKPGHYVPVTVENDVAPYVELNTRKEVVVPNRNQTGSSSNMFVRQAASMMAPECKLVSPKAAPSAPAADGEGQVIPVAPVDGTGPSGPIVPVPPVTGGRPEVPCQSIPFSQVPIATSQLMLLQPQSSLHVEQVSMLNESGPLTEGASDAQRGEGKLVRLTDLHAKDSLQSSKSDAENGKESAKFPSEDFVAVLEQVRGNRNEPF